MRQSAYRLFGKFSNASNFSEFSNASKFNKTRKISKVTTLSTLSKASRLIVFSIIISLNFWLILGGHQVQAQTLNEAPSLNEAQSMLRTIPKMCFSSEAVDPYLTKVNSMVRLILQKSNKRFQKISSDQSWRFIKTKRKGLPESMQEMYAQKSTFEFLDQLNAKLNVKFPEAKLSITALTTELSFSKDRHCLHLAGTAFDLRPLPAYRAGTWAHEDIVRRDQNKWLVMQLLSDHRITRVIYNDPYLLADQDIEKIIKYRQFNQSPVAWHAAPSHDNHLHVELGLDFVLEQKAIELLIKAEQK